MLARRFAFIAVLLAVPAALVGGCIVTEDSDGHPDIQTTSNGPAASSSSGGGEGGVGGSSGQGGAGGSGGSGGSAACVGTNGTGKTVAACDALNVAPAQGAPRQCGDTKDEDPIGYRLCKHAFDIFAGGPTEDLVSCLSTIGVQNACDLPPAQQCLTKMYTDACVNPDIAARCTQIATACGTPIDEKKCATDLNPFSNAGIMALVDCINMADKNLTCQQAYDACYPQVMTF